MIPKPTAPVFRGVVPEVLWLLLGTAWELGIAVSSNIAREYAAEIALAASLGWLTVVTPDRRAYTRAWNITAAGIAAYHRNQLHAQHSANQSKPRAKKVAPRRR